MGDEIDDIFAEYEAILSDDEQRERGDEGISNNADNSTTPGGATEAVVVPKRKVVKNPRLKFDPDRLCGPRGIPVLLDHFKDVKFKGKGHEVEDLDLLLSNLEHWTHRLFPSMKFLDSLRQIEKLGKKRPVQTCLQKLHLDIPVLDTDLIRDEANGVAENGEEDCVADVVEPSRSAFDSLLENHHNEMGNNNSDHIVPMSSTSSDVTSITEEQRLRMERNRQLAAERRKSRLAVIHAQETTPPNLAESNSIPHDEELRMNHFVEEKDASPFKVHNPPSGVNKKSAKRLRVLSDSEESCDLDDLVEASLCEKSTKELNPLKDNVSKEFLIIEKPESGEELSQNAQRWGSSATDSPPSKNNSIAKKLSVTCDSNDGCNSDGLVTTRVLENEVIHPENSSSFSSAVPFFQLSDLNTAQESKYQKQSFAEDYGSPPSSPGPVKKLTKRVRVVSDDEDSFEENDLAQDSIFEESSEVLKSPKQAVSQLQVNNDENLASMSKESLEFDAVSPASDVASYEKASKRLRVFSDSEESCDMDTFAEASVLDEINGSGKQVIALKAVGASSDQEQFNAGKYNVVQNGSGSHELLEDDYLDTPDLVIDES